MFLHLTLRETLQDVLFRYIKPVLGMAGAKESDIINNNQVGKFSSRDCAEFLKQWHIFLAPRCPGSAVMAVEEKDGGFIDAGRELLDNDRRVPQIKPGSLR